MKVIVPNKLSLLSCSLSETDSNDGAAWNAATTYAKDTKVRHNHVSYSSLADNNKGNDPSKTWSGTEAKWKKLEWTRPWRMLDDYVETQTIGAKGQVLSFCVPFDRANSFALLNLEGYAAHLTVRDMDEPADEQVIHEEELDLIADIFHLSLYEYNYLPITYVANIAKSNLPQVRSGRLCVELDPGSDLSAAIGHVVVGRAHTLGYTNYGAEISFTDYSRKVTDEFGVTTLVRRSYASHASLPIYLHPDQMDYVNQILASVRGIPCLWLGDNFDRVHSSLTIYGWMEDFRMTFDGPNECNLSLEIQGLI